MATDGYGSGLLSAASGTLMDIVSEAAAGVSSTCQSLTESLQGRCQAVAGTILSYKYQERAITDQPDFPDTRQPVWLAGGEYSAQHDLPDLRALVTSKLWFTYRSHFPPIGESGITSDQGWGCMLRCGQMVLGSALIQTSLSKIWRWDNTSYQEKEYRRILAKFQDNKSSPFSIHQIALMGESVENKPVGTWFGPNTVAQVLRKLLKFDPSNQLVIHVAMDNALFINEVKRACFKKNTGDEGSGDVWHPLLLFISLRLGLQEINPVYVNGLKTCFTFPQTQGVIGGRPNHALYMIGCVEDEIVFLDPHVTQQTVNMDAWEEALALCESVANESRVKIDSGIQLGKNSSSGAHQTDSSEETDEGGMEFDVREGIERMDSTFHCTRPGRISISALDPSLSLCFLCESEEDFDNLCILIQERIICKEKHPLFEMMLERPAGMFSQYSCDIPVQPDESTGQDYEKVERRYDSEEEFEIL